MYAKMNISIAVIVISLFVMYHASKVATGADSASVNSSLSDFIRVGTNGHCTDANFEESTARRFEEVGCGAAMDACVNDSACAGLACVDSHNLSVIYTTAGCVIDCDKLAWIQDRELITNTKTVSSQPYWDSAVCYKHVTSLPNVPATTTTTTATTTTATTAASTTSTTVQAFDTMVMGILNGGIRKCPFSSSGSCTTISTAIEAPWGVNLVPGFDGSWAYLGVDSAEHRVRMCTASGTCITVAGTAGSSGTGSTQFASPRGVSLDSDNNLVISDWGNNRVQKCQLARSCTTVAGDSSGSAASSSSDTTKLHGPVNTFVASNGDYIIADGLARCQRCPASGSGACTSVITSLDQPTWCEEIAGGDYIASDNGSHSVVRCSSPTSCTYVAGCAGGACAGDGNDQLRGPQEVHLDANGDYIVMDGDNSRVQRCPAITPSSGTVTCTTIRSNQSGVSLKLTTER